VVNQARSLNLPVNGNIVTEEMLHYLNKIDFMSFMILLNSFILKTKNVKQTKINNFLK